MRAPSCIFARIQRGKRQEPEGLASPLPGLATSDAPSGAHPGRGGGASARVGFPCFGMLFRCVGRLGHSLYSDGPEPYILHPKP